MSPKLAAFLILGISPAAAQAQDRTGAAQIPALREAEIPAADTSQPTGEAPAQLSGNDDSSAEQPQLTSAASSGQQTAQVASRTRDPQPPEPLSTREQGRTSVVERVEGHDRCDPAEGSEKATLNCKKVIENRAAEYRRAPVTQLSPEQKLMIDQQLRANEDGAQRLAQSGDPESNLNAMGIASVVLSQREGQEETKKNEQDQQNQAAIQAIISILESTQPK